jgi:hypothetical protein
VTFLQARDRSQADAVHACQQMHSNDQLPDHPSLLRSWKCPLGPAEGADRGQLRGPFGNADQQDISDRQHAQGDGRRDRDVVHAADLDCHVRNYAAWLRPELPPQAHHW